LPVAYKGRLKAIDMQIGDEVAVSGFSDNETKFNRIDVNDVTLDRVEKIGSLSFSYDVTTESDYFDVSGIISHNCRTMIGNDVNGMGYNKIGRGNNSPVTIILPKLALDNKDNMPKFWDDLTKTLKLSEKALLDRYDIQKRQTKESAIFMYENGAINNADKCIDSVEEALIHNTFGIGYIGIAEMCQALFGKDHSEDSNVLDFALSVVARIHNYCKDATERLKLNFSCYATPAENLCKTAMEKLKETYGVIENVTSRDFLTNSHHVPVWQSLSIMDKLKIEAKFCKYPTGGCITYVELDSSISKNIVAIEKIIDYAFQVLDIPYLAFNFPIDTCLSCGFSDEIKDCCPKCGGTKISRLKRITGYLSQSIEFINSGKQAEVVARVKHKVNSEFL
jgi:ribonucleoside-triphosphate reductase